MLVFSCRGSFVFVDYYRKRRAKQLAIHGSVLRPSKLKNIAAQLQSAAVS